MRLKEFRSKRLSHSKTAGMCYTVFGTCQSVGQVADGKWADVGSREKKDQIGPLGQEDAS